MGAGIIEIISNIVNITGNPILDTIIFAVIGLISGSIAFGFVEMLFDFTGKYNSKDMSDVHWGIRVFIFAFLTFVLVKIAQFFRWLSNPPQVYFLLGFIIFVVLVVVSILVIRNKKNITKVEKPLGVADTRQTVNDIQRTIEIDSRSNKNADSCPYCGGLLVQRKGPYGIFLGCSNYPECKYTQKK